MPSRDRLRAAALLLLLLTAVHHDVILQGRSLIASNFRNPLDDRPLADNYGPALVPQGEWGRRNLFTYANIRDAGATWWQWEPSTQFLKQAIALREWPFWDPYVGGGAPAMANLTAAFFFPPYTLVVFLGASPALLNAYFLALLWQASFFTFLFVRRHDVGFMASMLAAAMVMLGGALQQHLGTFNGQTAACLPFVMYVARRYLDQPGRRTAAALALACAVAALASFPPVVLAIFALAALYLLVGLTEQPRGRRAAVAGGWIASLLLAVGLVAFCYAPAFAARAAAPQLAIAYAHAGLESMQPRYLFQLLSATLAGGVPVYVDAALRMPSGYFFPYVGIVVLLLAGMAAPVGPRTRTLFVACGVGVVLIVLKLLGVPPVQWVGHLPVFHAIHFAQYFGIPLGFLLACLAALGAQRLADGCASLSRAVAVALLGVGAVEGLWRLGGAYGVFTSRAADYWIRDWRVLGVVTVVAGVVLVVGTVLRQSARTRGAAVAALLSLAIGECAYNGWYPNPAPWSIFDHPVPFVKAIQERAGGNRLFAFGAPNANLNEAFGIFSMDSLMTFNPPRAHQLYHRYAAPPISIFMRGATTVPPDPVLDRANVALIGINLAFRAVVDAVRARGYARIFDDGFIAVFERPTLPRFFYSSEYRQVEPSRALDAVAAPNAREIVVETDPGVPSSPNQAGDPAVQVEAQRRNSIAMVVEAPRPGLVYAAEAYFEGWTATRNGVPVEILAANHAFRAVAVPAGRSRIEFRYWPPGLTIGLWVSGASVLVLVGMTIGRAGAVTVPRRPIPLAPDRSVPRNGAREAGGERSDDPL